MLFDRRGSSSSVDNTEELTLESQSLILEAALCDELSSEELHAFTENSREVNGAIRDEIILEKSIVRLDKKAKLNKAYMASVFTIAKEKGDKKFKKLVTLWKMEKIIENYLIKRYGNEAMRRAKQAMRKPAKSSSSLVKKAVTNVNKQLNGGIKK